MGYYVEIIDGKFLLKRENYREAYRLLCALNERDDLKSGRRFPADLKRPAESKSAAKDPNVWFAWMQWNYDELLDGVVEILEEVGFQVEEDESGIVGLWYNDKTGCEEHFLRALAPVVEPGSCLIWKGEDLRDFYEFVFDGEAMACSTRSLLM